MSPEITNSTPLPTPQELAANPDLLMQPDVIRQIIADPEALLPADTSEADQAETNNDQTVDPQQVVHEARRVVGQGIIGPELAVIGSREAVARTAQSSQEAVDTGWRRMDAAVETIESVPVTFRRLQSELPAVRNTLHQLRDVLREPQFDGYHARSMVNKVREFAEQYGVSLMRGQTAYQDSAHQVYGGTGQIEDVQGQLRGTLSQIDQLLDDAPSLAGGSFDPAAVEAAINRGSTTLRDHEAACVRECDAEKAKVAEAWRHSVALTDAGTNVARILNTMGNELETLPHPRRLYDEVDGLNSTLYQIENSGPMMMPLASEALDRIEYQLMRLQQGLETQDGYGRNAQSAVEDMRSAYARLRQSELFAA